MQPDPEIQIVRHLPSRIDVRGDESLPYLVHVNLRPPEFMSVAWALLYGGSEEILARCASREAVDRFLDSNELRDHPRLRRISITSPDGTVERIGER